MIHPRALIICRRSQGSKIWIEPKELEYPKEPLVPEVDIGDMVTEAAKRDTVELCWWSPHQECMILGKSVLGQSSCKCTR